MQTIEQGDIFGRIGKGLGQGFSETLPKAQERGMLSNELQKISKEPGLSEIDKLSRISRVPGGLENYHHFAPLLQQAQQRTEFNAANQPAVSGELGTKNQEFLPASKGYKPRLGTTEALAERAKELIASQPSLYRDPNTATAKALQEFQTEQSSLSTVAKEFNEGLSKRLESKDNAPYKDVIGDMQADYLREAQALAATGKMSDQEAVDTVTKDLLDFAKTRTNLKSASVPFLFGSTEKDKVAQGKLNTIRQGYADRDRLDLFEDDLVNNVGLSTPVAASIANPLKSNKEINNYAHDTKQRFSVNPFKGSKFDLLINGIPEKSSRGTKKRSEKEIGNFIADNLKDGDSLNSIATTFNGRGYDPQKILNEIQDRWNSGKLRLTPRQVHDLEKRTTFRPTLKDISFFAGTGLNPLELVP